MGGQLVDPTWRAQGAGSHTIQMPSVKLAKGSMGNFRDGLLLPCKEWNNDLDMGHPRIGVARVQKDSTTNPTVGPTPRGRGNAGHRAMVHTAMDKQGYWGTSASDRHIGDL
jgi:hypothetical protein